MRSLPGFELGEVAFGHARVLRQRFRRSCRAGAGVAHAFAKACRKASSAAADIWFL